MPASPSPLPSPQIRSRIVIECINERRRGVQKGGWGSRLCAARAALVNLCNWTFVPRNGERIKLPQQRQRRRRSSGKGGGSRFIVVHLRISVALKFSTKHIHTHTENRWQIFRCIYTLLSSRYIYSCIYEILCCTYLQHALFSLTLQIHSAVHFQLSDTFVYVRLHFCGFEILLYLQHSVICLCVSMRYICCFVVYF